MAVNWIWVDSNTAFSLHDDNIEEFGGGHGIRDRGLVLSALNRPRQMVSYGETPPDVADLAAAYAHGLVKNHGFMDGNKRTAYVVTELFLNENGYALNANADDIFKVLLDIANNDMTQDDLADWLRTVIK